MDLTSAGWAQDRCVVKSKFAWAVALGSVALVSGVAAPMAADGGAPWVARKAEGAVLNLRARARISPEEWPHEPRSPEVVDVERLSHALTVACRRMPPGQSLRYATWIDRYATEFRVDPFLIAAIMVRRTRGWCNPNLEGGDGELGLTQIPPDLYRQEWRDGQLVFQVRESGTWIEKVLPAPRLMDPARLHDPSQNLYAAAALLRLWTDQEESVHQIFEQVPHRHPVSHFAWGDQVESDRHEDQVLTDRRRILEYYGAIPPAPPIERLGLQMGSPLDGAPRVVSSGIGSPRDGGERRHRGIDFESLPHEPVRVIADGEVIFSGIDLPGRASQLLRVDEFGGRSRRGLGAGGFFVCVRHPREGQEPLTSCYMHLHTVALERGMKVRRGDLVGTVGRTGMRLSAAHLHFELRGPTGHLNPRDVLPPLALGDPNPDVHADRRLAALTAP